MLKMDPNKEIEKIDQIADDTAANDAASVDDFIKQLEEKEKDLHITAETTIIEIAESFDDANLPEFIKEELAGSVPAAVATSPAKTKPADTLNADLEREISELREQIAQLEDDRKDALKMSERRAKDFQAYKSRTERERHETFQNQISNLATQMLPVLDNLDRAIDFALTIPNDQRADIQQFFDGIVLVNQQVNDVLAEMGIQPIATVGETFDPHFHEAVATEESDEIEANTISAELLRGYRIGDRVVRHSMVKVARAPRVNDPGDEVVDDSIENMSDSQASATAEPSDEE